MSKKFLFTITTGRSGTVFLTSLLKANLHDAKVFHERTGYQSFGVNTPDASHFMLFNSVGNVDKVRAFWRQKFERDRLTEEAWYVETSHFLAKAGLMENIDLLRPYAAEIHVILQRRDVFKTLWSFVNRFDFLNSGFTWLFTLDPRYPKVIVNSKQFVKYGMFGSALWYIIEMQCRAEYYRQLYIDDTLLHFHSARLEDITTKNGATEFLSGLVKEKIPECKIPRKVNETKQEYFGDKERDLCRELVEKFKFDPVELAKLYIGNGGRL
ncbi:MAG: hypothetical protein HY854_04260 [Burkholderiales bacterium]|nr:hypothetical protein [Burkholderiales bacterium]